MARPNGRPTKPAELKRLLGNPGGRPLRKPMVMLAPATVSVIDPVNDGDDFVRALIESQAGAWISEPDRIGLLELVRTGWNDRLALRAAVESIAGTWETGRYQPAALVRLAQVEKDLTGWLSLLGLTPSDRSRLGVAAVKARSNLDALRDRRASRNRAG